MERLIVVGGDGTVHLAIQHLAETPVAMTVLPHGTGNDVHRALLEANLVGGSSGQGETAIDLLRVTSDTGVRWVASIVIAGFPAAVNARANASSLPIGKWIYTLAAVRELAQMRRVPLSGAIDGDELDLDTAMLAIGSTAYFGGGMLACPDALPDDGAVHLTSIEGVGPLGLIPHLVQKSGGSAGRSEVLRRKGCRVTLETPGIDLYGDGEFVGKTPATIELIPGALRLGAMVGH